LQVFKFVARIFVELKRAASFYIACIFGKYLTSESGVSLQAFGSFNIGDTAVIGKFIFGFLNIAFAVPLGTWRVRSPERIIFSPYPVIKSGVGYTNINATAGQPYQVRE